MARKKRGSSTNTNGYLLSFGNTMTVLLAFFIVLNSLAEDQTGASLHAGTGSFVQAIAGFGLTNAPFGSRSSVVVQGKTVSPVYRSAEMDDDGPLPDPDSEPDRQRVIDWEREQWNRFLNEMDHHYGTEPLPGVRAQIAFDFFERLAPEPPRLPHAARRTFSDLLPLLRRENYRVAVVVWASTPSLSAWERAAIMAQGLQAELADLGSLQTSERQRLVAVGKPWHESEERRPYMSLLVIKLEEGG